MEADMAKDFSGGMNFEFNSKNTRAEKPEPETPFRILVLADLSGRESRGMLQIGAELATRRPAKIDVDNFDKVMEKMGVELQLKIGDAQDHKMALQFKKLEDFHPDRLAERSPIFQMLKKMKGMLASPATFE